MTQVHPAAADALSAADVLSLRALGVQALRRMYVPAERLFAFRLRREDGQDVLEGISLRYSGIVLIALAAEPPDVQEEVLGGSVEPVCDRLVERARTARDPGEVALALWAARVHAHPGSGALLERLRAMRPDLSRVPTVELAWALSALSVPAGASTDEDLSTLLAERLMRSFVASSGLFPHTPEGRSGSPLRRHVCCYADLVYPIQALSYYHRASGSGAARETAVRCARAMCALQGPAGQWWWHYDVRTGRVLERYPVYAIHQDAMGPMALLDAQDCCGGNYWPSVVKSMRWLLSPPELDAPLVDAEAGVIWRKVARREPHKLARRLQAGLSRLHPAWRVPGVDVLFPAGAVDLETRPYHMGWMLYAWNARRVAVLGAGLNSRGAA